MITRLRPKLLVLLARLNFAPAWLNTEYPVTLLYTAALNVVRVRLLLYARHLASLNEPACLSWLLGRHFCSLPLGDVRAGVFSLNSSAVSICIEEHGGPRRGTSLVVGVVDRISSYRLAPRWNDLLKDRFHNGANHSRVNAVSTRRIWHETL